MSSATHNHPCFSCLLPDCDDSSLRCPLRQALNRYEKTRVRPGMLTDEIRSAKRLAYQEIYGWRRIKPQLGEVRA